MNMSEAHCESWYRERRARGKSTTMQDAFREGTEFAERMKQSPISKPNLLSVISVLEKVCEAFATNQVAHLRPEQLLILRSQIFMAIDILKGQWSSSFEEKKKDENKI